MKKTYLLWFALLTIIMLGCRSESINSEETNTISQQKFNVVSKNSIPSIINELQSSTNNFRISLKTNSSEGKTETAFGEIDTNYIISTEKDGETYYIFPIISKSDSETTTYNLELKASEGIIQESKVLAYEPTDEWLLNGNDDYTSFSGTISTYDIGGDLETSSTYVNGKSGCTPQEPCPDCPVNPNGPGGTDGGGTPGGGWTGTGSGGGGGTTGGDGGGTSGGGSTGGVWLLHCETINKELKCWMVFYSQKVSVSACGGSAGGVITVYVPSSYINTILTQYHSSLALSESEKNFLNSNKDIANNLADFLRKNNTQKNAAFVKWAAWFFTANPNTTWEQFKNWFMGESEGQDGEYDASYWDDPNLTFPQQNLPSWAAFSSAYPNESSAQMYGVVGGAVAQAQIDYPVQTRNGCALKVSRALNYSGVIIPNIPGQTLKGADNKNYFLNAKALNAWMRKTFGVYPTNPKHKNFTKSQGGVNGQNFPNLFKNKKGIYSLVSPTNSQWASGHADILYLNGTCKAGCHFFDGDILYIDFWELN
ncbi:T6SS effector amidase Tae4 family protein [Epilithonimonas vandammei]|uniref:Uncharacterized protein n=1 Tax=Epilithonimonas vandammei TaxID=2487072 RepID=A0A3G8Y0P8_9FLAO|nr:T6SS effector amidase Tae4 family protein [Epilithonimonas vandammei]AZI39045.1 hypothetical protein EIB74_03260 [Epilithonimonas vandammei]